MTSSWRQVGLVLRRDRRLGRNEPTSEETAAHTYDAFGQRLHLLASVLTDDPELVEQLVVQTIVAHASGVATLRELASGVHAAWIAWGCPPVSPTVSSPPSMASDDLLRREVLRLTDDHRAVLGLCRFGGHTYREAADAMGIPADRAARMLGEALRELGAMTSGPVAAVA